MKKILLGTVLVSTTLLSYANFNYTNFQNFDNQVSFGLNSQNGNFNTSQANGNPDQFSITSLNIEVEKLFDIGLWFDFNASVAQTNTQTEIVGIGASSNGSPLGSYAYLQTMNAKIGYNFPITDYFAIVPYINLGKNANLTMFNSLAGLEAKVNVTNDFFYTAGGGLRLELPINKYFDIYLDQMVVANMDQTNFNINALNGNPADIMSPISSSNTQWTTTLGVKVNPWQKLQLGANVFYTNYNDYSQQSVIILNNNATSVPTTVFGFQLSAGFTFE
jgi:opacity protein-like surface antigen